MEDGSIVNENVRYEDKKDVYLDGGPGQHAPASAAGLPEGDYYFQVTEPNGRRLLSEDAVDCRRIRVNGFGVIEHVYAATQTKGNKVVDCTHNQGVDADHGAAPENAITVQLFPYKDTHNKGGVYKVWITPVERFVGDTSKVDNHEGNFHGFLPALSKTDNFKVKEPRRDPIPHFLLIQKFHDANLNCVKDADEDFLIGWPVVVKDEIGVSNLHYTTVLPLGVIGILIEVQEENFGVWTTTEGKIDGSLPDGTIQTSSFLDGVQQSCFDPDPPGANPVVTVDLTEDLITRVIVYGNVGVCDLVACKFYDVNLNGVKDAGEPSIPGWKMVLTGTDAAGAEAFEPVPGFTGADGCVTFAGLLPGINYKVTEIIASTGIAGTTWEATTATFCDRTVVSETTFNTDDPPLADGIKAKCDVCLFGNVCKTPNIDFDTKGYWHNKNGLAEIVLPDDIDCVNALLPYATASTYFDAGDEPFDGMFSNGDPVAASNGILGEELAPEGSTLAEVSQFLVDKNAGGDPCEQLAQQLLAFIFNTKHRLDSPDDVIEPPGGGTPKPASQIITEAIAAWASGDCNATATLLDKFNNATSEDGVNVIHAEPCDVIYAD